MLNARRDMAKKICRTFSKISLMHTLPIPIDKRHGIDTRISNGRTNSTGVRGVMVYRRRRVPIAILLSPGDIRPKSYWHIYLPIYLGVEHSKYRGIPFRSLYQGRRQKVILKLRLTKQMASCTQRVLMQRTKALCTLVWRSTQ